MNDNSPQFERQFYQGYVEENLPIGTIVTQVMAKDKDAGINADIRYILQGEKIDRFNINIKTGEITTAAVLDREETDVYQLTVKAIDSSPTEPRFSIVNMNIIIQDINDNTPMFSSSSFNIIVPDDIQSDEFVFGASAIDLDAGNNAKIIYNISGKDANNFIIDMHTGVIKTKRKLTSKEHFDMEYKIVMHATDMGKESKSSMADLTILSRASSLFPKFSITANTQFIVAEDAREGTFITKIFATSPKKGQIGNINYYIAGGNIHQAVRVDALTGEVTIGKDGLDYETIHHYQIWVEAVDSDVTKLRAAMLLTINVTDANDNIPVFEQLIYKAEILEEEPPSQSIIKIKATDRDSGENGEISYRLVDDLGGYFEIDTDSGEIFTTIRLDREQCSTYDIVVEAVDQGMPQMTGTATVLLSLLDKNDNPPKFTRLFSVNVTENAEIGSFVIQVTSSDLDIGMNANASYSITENPGNKFNIDEINGNVTVAGHLDREQQDEYLLKIVASDGSWRAETPITITIQDQNDNTPEFEHSYYSFNFPELQRAFSFVGQVIAADRDKQGPNSVISYSLQHPSDLFAIDPATGSISSKRTIKYKHSQYVTSPENMYSLQVFATDNGKPPLYSECLVHINIVDYNKNAPKFLKSSYLSAVPEKGKVDQLVVRVQAIDEKDYGPNAEIDYSLIGGNATGYFKIDKKEGWISIASTLDVPTNTIFVIKVKAADHGVPVQTDEAYVTIVVTGDNLHTPEFTALSYQVFVPENEPTSSTILTVTATDKDEGPNGMLRYEISGGNGRNKFTVDAVKGSVTILQSLDFDSVQEYHVNITVKDLAYEPKSSVAMITIILTDVNDNPPLFNQTDYHAYIEENKPEKTLLYRMFATDKDSPKNAIILYNIIGGSGKNLFAINEHTGEINSSVIFDYEEQQEYNLKIRASNPDSLMQSTCMLFIHITSVNEFYPEFLQSVFHFDVSETAAIGTVVGAVRATDKDAGKDGNIYYILAESNNDKSFSLNIKTGVIIVTRHLNREKQSRILLGVIAKNYGGIRGNDFDECQVIITVQDGNDPPEFLKTMYTASVAEDTAIGTKLLTVKAIDEDVRPQNNQFSYTIINGNINDAFKIDALTGDIETAIQLDRESISSYSLSVGAVDIGLPPQTGTTLVIIDIQDVNDNPPIFDHNDLIVYITENEQAGTLITTLTPSDSDLPPNGAPFTFQLLGGKHKAMLSIDKYTGIVKSSKSYDREETPILEATFEVEDNGKPKQRAQYSLTVKVLDQNDNPSYARNVKVLVNLYNNKIPIGKIANIHPNDVDLVGNYECRFVPHIKSSPLGIFNIHNMCELHTTYQTAFKEYAYSVSGDDGKHAAVISSLSIAFNNFSADTVAHSVTILVKGMSAEHFVEKYYENFTNMIKADLELNDELQIISIKNSGYNETNMELYLAIQMSNQLYRSERYVTELLKKKREAFERLFQAPEEIIIAYNPCNLANTCQNGGICNAEIRVNDDVRLLTIVDSPVMIFTSPQVIYEYVCKCSDGFAGEQCNKRQDPCTPNPCQADAQCRRIAYHYQCVCPANREGKYCQLERGDVCSENPCHNGGSCRQSSDGSSYFCMCRAGYRGNQCEHITDSCRPNPCLHGGYCINLKPGYKCSCLEGRYGTNCEKSNYGFQELSYMTFPPLDAVANDISIIFATTKPNALLIYNFGAQVGGRSDFLALEVVKGKAYFSLGGARTAITTIVVGTHSKHNLADGNWHKVTATRNGRVMSLSVAKCSENGDICEECRHGDINCYVDDVGPVSSVNFNKNNLLIGGLYTADAVLERPGQIHTDDLVGCVHSIFINGRMLNMSNPLNQRGVLGTCNRNRNGGPCQKSITTTAESVCGNYGTCFDRWHFAFCQCGGQLVSPDCFASLEPISLTDGGFVEFKISEKHRRMQLLDNLYGGNSLWSYDVLQAPQYKLPSDNLTALPQTLEASKSLSLLFKTYKADGLILYAATNKHFTMLELKAGKMLYKTKQSKTVNMTAQVENLHDGKWHNVTLHTSNRMLLMLIDNEHVAEKLDFSNVHDFLDPYLTELSMGGLRKEHLPQESSNFVSFEGCLANFTINNEIQPLNTSAGSIFKEIITRGKVTTGCGNDAGVGASQVKDQMSIGITLVIVFFVILVVAILGSFVIYRFRGKQEKMGGLSCGVPGLKIKHPSASTILVGGVVSQNQADHVLTRSIHANDGSQLGYHMDSGDLVRGVPGQHLVGHELLSKKFKEREIVNADQQQQQRPQRPDIIEREVVNQNSPLREDHHHNISNMGQQHHAHDRSNSVDLGSEYPEHYDLENASSIAPSDIDIVYHYNRYREAAGVRKYKATPPPVASYSHHKHPSGITQQHRHSPRHGGGAPFVPRVPQASQPPPPSNSTRQHQSTPLARLSPSSELSSQQPRILTLQDISGKPLQSALLATTSSSGGVGKDVMHSNSERSLNSPVMSQMSGQSSSASRQKPVVQTQPSAQTPISLTAEEIERLNVRPRTSSLVSTLDAVSSSSEVPRVNGGHLSMGADVDAHSSTSTDESGNDSFTCSEIEYDNNSLSGDVNKYQPNKSMNNELPDRGGVVGSSGISAVGKAQPMPCHAYDNFDSSFRGSLSTLVASDDDLSTHIGLYRGQPNGSASPSNTTLGWDYLLNWGPNFESLVGVFKDIAELPDSVSVASSLRLTNNVQKASEEYV